MLSTKSLLPSRFQVIIHLLRGRIRYFTASPLTWAAASFGIAWSAALLYSTMAVRGQLVMTWLSFMGWLAILVATNVWVTIVFWHRRHRYDRRKQLGMLLWSGVINWYWIVAPFYYFLTISVTRQELAWIALSFLWEVPILIGLIFIGACLILYEPLHRYLRHGIRQERLSTLYQYSLGYPIIVGVILIFVSIVMYAFQSIQLTFESGFFLIDQFESGVNGAVVSLLLSAYFYLAIDFYLAPVRQRLSPSHAGSIHRYRSLRRRIVSLTMLVTLGTVALLGLITFSIAEDLITLSADGPLSLHVLLEQPIITRLLAGAPLVFLLTTGIVIFYSIETTKAIRSLATLALRSAEAPQAIPANLMTADEVEVLSRAFIDTVNQLREEKIKAQRLDRAKSEFISLASHELRTPLTAIRWYLERLGKRGQLTGDQRMDLLVAERNTKRMIALVNSLLNVSRLETGRLSIKPEEYDLVTLIQSSANDMKPMANEQKCEIRLELVKDAVVLVDRALFQHVMNNLLTNALRYLEPKRKGMIKVSLKLNDDLYEVSVTDNGIGIPQSEVTRIFEKFYRTTSASSLVPDGTGLGLYIVRRSLVAANCSITCTSREGMGTTFTVLIPKDGMRARTGEVQLT